MKSFVIAHLTNCYAGNQIREDNVAGRMENVMKKRNAWRVLVGTSKERGRLEDLSVMAR
jgi:hypothetical protein